MSGQHLLSSKIRIRQLRCFVSVARRKSFVLAAEDMGLTQPAVSRSVRELEQIIGHALFDRTKRGAHLTERGQVLLEAAELGLLQISQGVVAATEEAHTAERVRIGALPNVCSQILPDVIKRFKDSHPEVMIRILPGTNAELLAGLRRGETDFVIGRLSESSTMRGLVFEALYDEPLVFVVGADHPLANGDATLEQALEYPMLLPPEGTIIRQEVAQFLASQGATKLGDVVETTSSDFQRAYLSRSACVAAIPRGVVQNDLDAGTLVQLPIGERSLTGPVGLTTNPEIRPSQTSILLMNEIRDAV